MEGNQIDKLQSLRRLCALGTHYKGPSLNLANNQIETLPGWAFCLFRKYWDIYLYANRIFKIDPQAFSGVTKITRLELQDNHIKTLGTLHISTKYLQLWNNHMDHIVVDTMAQVKVISASHNHLHTMPVLLGNHHRLQRFFLDINQVGATSSRKDQAEHY